MLVWLYAVALGSDPTAAFEHCVMFWTHAVALGSDPTASLESHYHACD